MKQILTFILISVFTNCYSQSSTTIEEYNYLTKGYKIQVESGLDMKKGYSLVDYAKDVRRGDYSFTAKGLFREKNNELAALLVIVKSLRWEHTYYVCIPIANEELQKVYYKQFEDWAWDRNISLAYAQVCSLELGRVLSVAVDIEKKIKASNK